jgi:hypothetical protein
MNSTVVESMPPMGQRTSRSGPLVYGADVLALTYFKFREVGCPNCALPWASFNHSLGGKPKKGYELL